MCIHKICRILFVIVILTTNLEIVGQVWEYIYEPEPSMGREIVPALGGGFVVTGTNSNYDEGITLKLDQDGELLWSVPYGGFACTQCAQGYLIASNNDYYDGIFRMINDSGSLQWTKYFWEFDRLEFGAVITTSDSCFVACGRSTGDPGRSIIILKTDLEGEVIWSKSLFSFDYGLASDLIEYDGHYYVTGRYEDPDLNHFLTLIKLTTSGDLIWQKAYPFGVTGYSIALTMDTALVVGGGVTLAKFNLDGDTIWRRNFTPGWISSLDVANDNSIIIGGWRWIGSYAEKNLVARVDNEGNVLWWKLYPNGFTQITANFESIVSLGDNGFVACGYSDYDTAYLLRVIKADADGNIIVGTAFDLEVNSDLTIYPNPCTSRLKINYGEIERIEVWSTSGYLVGIYYQNEIDLSRLPGGIYLVKIEIQDRDVIKKIVKY